MQKQVVAAFDFDGTLTKRDTFIPFALFVLGFKKWSLCLCKLVPDLFKYFFRRINRQGLKEKALTYFFPHFPEQELNRYGIEFAEEIIPKMLKPKAMEKLRWHQNQGHLCILISASPETYLLPWGKKEHFDHILATRVEVDDSRRLTGKLVGKNCRGEEKVRRLTELLGPKTYTLYAYGDSPGDRELLDFSDKGYYRKI